MRNLPHPGDLIKTEIIEALGLNVSKAAEILKVRRATLSHLLHGKAALTPEMALRLEKAFGPDMDHLLRMQPLRRRENARARTGHLDQEVCPGLKAVSKAAAVSSLSTGSRARLLGVGFPPALQLMPHLFEKLIDRVTRLIQPLVTDPVQGFILGARVGARHSTARVAAALQRGRLSSFGLQCNQPFASPLQFHAEDDAGSIGQVRQGPDDSIDMDVSHQNS
jgi:addiction module HigA family antidote